jgi:hypothetical protein
MASATSIAVRVGPDLRELIEAFNCAVRDIASAHMEDDPRVVDAGDKLRDRLQRGLWSETVHAPGEVIVSCADDELLELFARFQALRQVAIASLRSRGWRL